MIRKTISFTETHANWMKDQIASGQYASESELIRDMIRQRQEEAKAITETPEEIAAIRKILDEAEESEMKEVDFEDIRQRALAELEARKYA